MEFEEALNTKSNEKMTLDEIIQSDDLEDIRTTLKCPFPGCDADLIYVAASPHPFLSTKNHRKSPHIEDCPHYKSETDSIKKKKKYQKVLAAFGENDISSRLDSLKDDIFPDRKKRTRKSLKSKKKPIDRTEQIEESGVILEPSAHNGIDPSSVTDRKPIKGRISKKRFTELLDSDKGVILKSTAQLISITKNSDDSYDFLCQQINGDKEATLKLRRSFFKRNISNINKQLKFLKEKVNSGKDIRIAFTGRVDSINPCEFEIYDDFGFKLGTVYRGAPILETLLLFYNRYSKK